MYSGPSYLSLDAKGRIAIPTRYREDLGVNLVLTADPKGCLLLFPEAHWQPFEERVGALPNLNRRIDAMQSLWLGYRTDCEVDAAGRLVLTPELRDYAKLDRKIHMIGKGDRFELWSERRWQDVVELAQTSWRDDPPAELAGLSV